MKKNGPGIKAKTTDNRFPLGRFALILFLTVGIVKIFQFVSPKKPEAADSGAVKHVADISPAQVVEAPRPGALGSPRLMTMKLDFDGVKSKGGYVGAEGDLRDWNPRIDKSIYGKTLAVHGKTYQRGLGVHAPSDITFELGGEIKRFSCLAGADSGGGQVDSVQFVVRGDNKKLFESKIMTADDDAVKIDLDVSGVQELSLIVNPVDQGSWDWADWIDVKFTKD
jgi:hypothetical protein